MKHMKNIIRHISYAVRYGDWGCGIHPTWRSLPLVSSDYTYYDGNHASVRLGPFYIYCFY